MFTTLEEFAKEFEQESALTEKVLDALTDESLSQAVSDNGRTLGRLAWHLVHGFNYMAQLGLTYDEPFAANQVPASAAEIASEYRRLKGAFMRAVRQTWTDESLKQELDLFGEKWTLGAVFRFNLSHEIHHRGQMTVLMRQAGLRVPGLYGPSSDEWIEMGKTPLE